MVPGGNVSRSSSGSGTSPRIGPGCLPVFMIPFFGAGLFFLGIGIKHLLHGRREDGFAFAGFAVVFLLFSTGFLLASMRAIRRANEQWRARGAQPDKPWMWRDDWAAGVVESGGVGVVVFAWGVALFWNGVSWPLLFVLFEQEWKKGNHFILFFLLFPVIGLGLLWWAIHAAMHWSRFGRSRFHLASVPGVLGGVLAGFVEIPVKVRADKGYRLRLWCVRRTVTGSGKHRSTREDLLWEESKLIVRDSLQHERGRTGVPVHFSIPFDLPSSEGGNPAIVWRLDVSADIPGVDYHASFEVPVFKTEASAPDAPPVKDPTAAYQPPAVTFTPPAGSRIRVRDLPEGVEIRFAAINNPTGTAVLLGVAGMWNLILWAIITQKAPLLFAVVFGLLDALILLLCWFALCYSVRVVATRSGLTIFHRMPVTVFTRRVAVADVRAVKTRLESYAGSKSWHGLVVETHGGEDYTAGNGVPDKQHAEWLAKRIATALGTAGADAPSVSASR